MSTGMNTSTGHDQVVTERRSQSASAGNVRDRRAQLRQVGRSETVQALVCEHRNLEHDALTDR